MVYVENDDGAIVSTNYWDSEFNARGLAFLSINAGVYRLLLPKKSDDWLFEIASAKTIVISHGLNRNTGKDGFEILFDDHSNNPFYLHIDERQSDRIPLKIDQGWKGKFAIYTHDKREPIVTYDKVYFRLVAIPCFLPAGKEKKTSGK
ncbi:MAG: hypothetical protein LBQ52_05440 [Helicobacteraceae bacterium]|jgi:hypothetical protein|nr:hypothetical protein [Helicobacteraceae bacterium]